MSYDIGPRIGIAGEKEFNEQIRLLNRSLRTLDAEMKAVASSFDANDTSTAALTQKKNVLTKAIENQGQKLNAVSAQYDKQKQKLEVLADELKKATDEFGANSAEAIKAESAYKKQAGVLETLGANVHTATANINNLNKELVEVSNIRLERLTQELDEVSTKMQSAGRKFSVMSAAVVAGAVGAAKAAKDYESAFAGVEKTVDGTAEQLENLSNAIRQMSKDIPSSANEIAGVAEAAGQLGIAIEDVESFTRVMIDLGVSTNMAAEEAATSLAKFANITKMSSDDYERLGDVIVDLGNSMATTERDIVNMATRLASTGSLVGLTEAQMMALAATLSSVGVEAEAGGSAISRLLRNFETMVATGKDLDRFAEVAGKSAEEFAEAWKNDPIVALTAFINGLGEISESGDSAVKTLEELGVTEIRLSNAILAMAASGDLLSNAVDQANRAWIENNALQTEAEKRYQTTESQMQMAQNTLTDIAITMGSEFLPMVNQAIGGIRDLGEWFSSLDDAGKENIIRILAIVAALGPMVTITGKAVGAVKSLTVAVTTYRSAAAAGATATTALNAAMSASPVGLLASGIALLGSVIVGSLVTNAITAADKVNELTEATEKAAESLNEINSEFGRSRSDVSSAADAADKYITRLEELENQGLKTAEAQKEYQGTISILNELIPDLNIKLDEQTGFIVGGTEALRENTEAWRENALAQSFADQYEEIYSNYADVLIEAAKNQNALAEAEQRSAVVNRELEESLKELEDGYSRAEEMTREEYNALLDLAEQTRKLEQEKDSLKSRILELTDALELSEGTLSDYEGQLKELDQTKETLIKTTEEETKTLVGAAISTEDLSSAVSELSENNSTLSSTIDKSSKAFAEQAEKGTLALSTILDLVDAGYAAALAVDEETGAVTLNKEAYIQLTQAKIDAQITDLEALRTDITTKLINEGKIARETAGDFAILAASKSLANDADYQGFKSTEAQIAALKSLRDNLTKTTAVTTTTAKRTATAAKQKSDAYSEAVKEIQYQLNMELISETEYWSKFESLRDRHLKKNSDEWKSANVKLFEWQKKQNEEKLKAEQEQLEKQATQLEDSLALIDRQYKDGLISQTEFLDRSAELRDKHLAENSEAWISVTQKMFDSISEIESARLQEMVESYNTAYESILADQASMMSTLSSYGKLFDDGQLTSLEDQIDALTRYGEQLDSLKERGISDSLLGEVTDMSIDEANAYMTELLALADADWERYLSLWDEKQDLARRTAEQFYKDQLDTLQVEFSDKLVNELQSLSEETFAIGQESADALAKGILSGQGIVTKALQDVVAGAIGGISAPAANINYSASHSFLMKAAPIYLNGAEIGKVVYDEIEEQGAIRGPNIIEGG